MLEKFEPQRTCVCCRKKTDKDKLVRIVSVGGKVLTDNEKKISGRGVYLCENCLKSGGKQLFKSLSRAFKRQITEEDAEQLPRL